jgi:hypothetical protein
MLRIHFETTSHAYSIALLPGVFGPRDYLAHHIASGSQFQAQIALINTSIELVHQANLWLSTNMFAKPIHVATTTL